MSPRPTPSWRAISSSTEIRGSRAASAGVHQRPATTVLWPGGSAAHVSTYSRVRYHASSRRVFSPWATGAPLTAASRERTTGVSSAGASAPCPAASAANGSAWSGWMSMKKNAGAWPGLRSFNWKRRLRLEQRDRDDQHHREAERHEHRPRVAARPVEIGRSLPPGGRAPAHPAGQRDDAARAQGQQQQRAGEAAREQRADLPGAGLPERERGQAGRDRHRRSPTAGGRAGAARPRGAGSGRAARAGSGAAARARRAG